MGWDRIRRKERRKERQMKKGRRKRSPQEKSLIHVGQQKSLLHNFYSNNDLDENNRHVKWHQRTDNRRAEHSRSTDVLQKQGDFKIWKCHKYQLNQESIIITTDRSKPCPRPPEINH